MPKSPLNDVAAILQNPSMQMMMDNQKLINALTAQIPPALLEYAETLNKLQHNFSSIFTSTAPIFKWANENQALLESFDTIAVSLQSIVPFRISEQVAQNFAKHILTFGKLYEQLDKQISRIYDNSVWQRYKDLFINLNDEYIQRIWTTRLDFLDLINQVEGEDNESEKLETEEGFSCNEEIYAAIEEQANNPIGFQEKFANWTEKKKKQFYVVCLIFYFIWDIFLQPYLQENVGKPVMAWTDARIKELPERTGNFIADLKENVEAIITENCPYYYKVVFVDENGETKEGYVSKRSVRVIETPEESEENISE